MPADGSDRRGVRERSGATGDARGPPVGLLLDPAQPRLVELPGEELEPPPGRFRDLFL